MTERAGLGGRVHDGFYGALFHGDEEAGALFTQLVEAIRAADDTGRKALYVTGAARVFIHAHCAVLHLFGGFLVHHLAT